MPLIPSRPTSSPGSESADLSPGGRGGPLSRFYERYLYPPGVPRVAFDAPAGEPALVAADSVSWRVFRNPVTLFAGGVLAVILELALPEVRHGVWDHSTFRTDPKLRLQRTGLAAMVTIYGAASVARGMIDGVNRRHAQISGETDQGRLYRADDAALLSWVHATAVFGFGRAYDDLVCPLGAGGWNRLFAEGQPIAEAYGAAGAPASREAWEALEAGTLPRLEPSDALQAFLRIMSGEPVLPLPARPLQAPLVRVAAGLVPEAVARRIALGEDWRPSRRDRLLAKAAARAAERLPIEASPPVQACRRLGLDPRRVFAGPLAS